MQSSRHAISSACNLLSMQSPLHATSSACNLLGMQSPQHAIFSACNLLSMQSQSFSMQTALKEWPEEQCVLSLKHVLQAGYWSVWPPSVPHTTSLCLYQPAPLLLLLAGTQLLHCPPHKRYSSNSSSYSSSSSMRGCSVRWSLSVWWCQCGMMKGEGCWGALLDAALPLTLLLRLQSCAVSTGTTSLLRLPDSKQPAQARHAYPDCCVFTVESKTRKWESKDKSDIAGKAWSLIWCQAIHLGSYKCLMHQALTAQLTVTVYAMTTHLVTARLKCTRI